MMKIVKPTLKFFLLTFLLLNLISCKKEKNEYEEFTVKYEVRSDNNWGVNIQWTGSDGGINGSSLVESGWENGNTDVYSYSFVTDKKHNIFLQGENMNPSYGVNIRLYVNGDLVQSAEANSLMKATISYQL